MTGKIPYFDELVDWYAQHLPDETKMGQRVVHGDYKLDNLIFHPVENHVIGVLDWELCTLGSPVSFATMKWSKLPTDNIYSLQIWRTWHSHGLSMQNNLTMISHQKTPVCSMGLREQI